MKLWKKKLFKALLSKFFLFLSILFFIYVMIDLSIRSNELSHSIHSLQENILYYLCTLSKRLDFLCCFSCLIATITCYTEMHGNRELLALQTSGVCRKEFTQPIYVFTILLSLLFIINFEFLYPKSALFLEKYESSSSIKKKPLLYLPLQKEQFLVYSNQVASDLQDVFYVMDTRTVFHMQKMVLSSPSQGYFVTQFIKNDNNEWERTASYPHHIFADDISNMVINSIDTLPLESRALGNLFYHSFIQPHTSQLPAMRSYFLYKVVKSILPILCIMAISNRFGSSLSRNYFFLYCLSLCNCIGIYALLGFLLILGTSAVCSAYVIIGIPILIIYGISKVSSKLVVYSF